MTKNQFGMISKTIQGQFCRVLKTTHENPGFPVHEWTLLTWKGNCIWYMVPPPMIAFILPLGLSLYNSKKIYFKCRKVKTYINTFVIVLKVV